MPAILLLAGLVGLAMLSSLASAADYFVDPAGSDANNGISQATPWQSLAKVNATTFQPGDNIYFKRGGTWYGKLSPQGSGNSTSQITLGTYGTGAKPLIDGGGAWAVISLSSQEYWTIDGFEVTNWGGGDSSRSGIRVDASGSQTTHRIRILNNDVHDIRGICNVNDGARNNGAIFLWINEPGKADDVLIQGNTVTTVYGQGINFAGEAEYAGGGMNYANCSPNVVVRGNRVLTTSGDGILLLGTDNELAECNEVGFVGQLSATGNNIAAAWPTRHVNGVWQYNYVHDTVACGNDSTAFDNDGFLSGTTYFQYNYTYNNHGGFFMEYQWGGDVAGSKSVVRYNISVNESRVVASNRSGALFYNNVFYSPGVSFGMEWMGSNYFTFRNNIFWGSGWWDGSGYPAQTYTNNTFWGGTWGPSGSTGSAGRDPLFVNPNSTGDLAGFILQSGSPERGTGGAIASNGGKDFWGATLPSSPTKPNRGASQIAGISGYTATPTYLSASGPSTATIPFTGNSNTAFSAELRDQNFRTITGAAMTWSLVPATAGYSINLTTGVLTISNSAAPARLGIVVQSGGLTDTWSVTTRSPTWDNGSGSWVWSSTDTNWSGLTWAAQGQAVFDGTAPGTINLGEDITASGMLFESGAGYVINGNGHLLGVSGDMQVASSGGVTLQNGTFLMQRAVTRDSGSSDWGNLIIGAGADVTATNGIDGSVGSPYTFALSLNGGRLTTPSIKVADLHAGWGSSYLTFNGTEVRASGDNGDFIQTYGDFGNNNSLTVAAGGAVLNSNGHSITINKTLTGDGGLAKNGEGTLTLTAANNYTGGTTANGGTLEIKKQNGLPGSGGITIGAGATLITNSANDSNTQSITSTINLNGGTLAAGSGTPAQNYNNGNPVGPWGNYYLAPGATIQAGGNVTSTISASLGVNGSGGYTPINVDGGSTLNISGNILGVSYVSWGGFSKSGGGTLVLGGYNKVASQGMILSAGIVEFSINSLPTNARAYGGPAGYSADFQGSATLRWASGNTQDISYENSAAQIRIGDGVTATFDTNGNNVTLGTGFDLGVAKTGAMTKTGSGTLTLSAANSYTGATTVSAGTLRLGDGTHNTNLADSADVILASGALLSLNFIGSDTVRGLVVGGIAKSPGAYSSSNTTFITGTGSLTVLTGPPSDYSIWASQYQLTGGPDADEDHDGISNFAEYAFGLNPKNGGSSQPILSQFKKTSGSFSYSRRKSSLSGLTYTVWTSTDLVSWTSATFSESVTGTVADVETVQVTLTPAPTAPKLFVQVRAQ